MTPEELWNLPPDEFNKWRNENDLLHLFNCFEKVLPHFNDWLTQFNLTIDFILNTNQPGEFFYWETDVFVVKSIDENFKGYFFVTVVDEAHEKQIVDNGKKDNLEQLKFKPYLIWAKQKLKKEKIINAGHSGEQETFRYNMYSAPDVPELSTATLNVGKTALKLGGTKVDSWSSLTFRDLDFTNLDFLEIEGTFSWSREIKVFYSACRNIKAKNTVGNFIKFYQCHFENLNVIDSRLYWVEFFKCEIFGAYFENTKLSNINFDESSFGRFSFNRVEVENIMYKPPKKQNYTNYAGLCEGVAENHKRFRVLFQSNGLRHEAADAYYKERVYEMKYLWFSCKFFESLTYLWKRNFKYGVSSIEFYSKQILRFFASLISYVIWGFGEKPHRIVLSSLATLTFYAFLFYLSDIERLHNNLLNAYYLSIVTFTTLGFGDITPLTSDTYKIIVASEALFGAFLMGLLVAGYANKSRY